MMTEMQKLHDFDTVYDTQALFRLILEATARPARPISARRFLTKFHEPRPHLLSIAMTLLDNEVTFCVLDDHALSASIAELTLSQAAPLEEADFVFVTEPAMLEDAICRAKCGTLRDPHSSASFIVSVDAEKECALRVSGPGIRGDAVWKATEQARRALEIRDAQQYEYPQGIDFLFVSDTGAMAAIPRLVRWEAM